MANMSAIILRNIVGSVFPVKTSNVILSGEINPEHVFQLDRGHSWWNGASEQADCAWGFDPKTGFKAITGVSGNLRITEFHEYTLDREYHYSNNGDCEHESGNRLCDLPEVEKFVFFLVNSQGKGYGETAEYYNTWTLYKAPNFVQKWAEIEATDVQRWNEWINTPTTI
jgi:hypothetical protein